MSMITFNLSNQFFFFVGLENATVRSYSKEVKIQSPVGTQNEGKRSHFEKASKSIFQKVAGGNCRFYLLLMNMKLKVTMYFFFYGYSYLHSAPTGFAAYLP